MTLQQVRAEALQESTSLTWRDRKFTIPPVDDWFVMFMHHGERGEFTMAIESALGEEQYAEFIGSRPRMSDLDGLINSLMSAYGLSLGEASASTD